MSASVAEQVIERSAQDVWAYAADIVRHAEWMTVTDARIVQGDGTQVGARGRERVRFGPFGWDVRVRGRRGRAGASDRLEVCPRSPVRSHGHAGPRAHWPSVDQGELRGGHPTARRCGGCCRRWSRWRPRLGRRANSQRLKAQVEAAPAMTPAMS